ncbi:MAG TPA: hypothetical protein DD636_02610 [Anaerolineaceae bacterium]|jgi:hypothetical protein|nr:hypothetical protein [Anaerolineaceae bacterium]
MNLPNWLDESSSRFSHLKASIPLNNPIVNHPLDRKEGRIIFILSSIANFSLVYLLNFVWHIGNSDALSRTANAFYVLYSREPHLAAVGFVWPPLPSILQLPLLPITKALGWVTLSGNIVSVLFGAGCLVMMNKLLVNLKFPALVRWILVGLLQFHPYTWYLFSAGMAEPIFLFFVLATLSGMNDLPRTMRSWVVVGLSLCAAFYVRYEALAMVVGVALAVIVHLWKQSTGWKEKTEGWLISILLPAVYGIVMWVFFNWSLMGDPLYFLRSVFSLSNAPDIAKIAGLTHPYYLAWGNFVEAIKVGVVRSFQQCPAYPIMTALAFISIIWHRNRKGFGLFIVIVSITSFTILQVYMGSLANWMRYWFYAAPFALVMAGIIRENLEHKWRLPFYLLLITLFIAGTPLSLQAMRDPQAGGDEQRLSALILAPVEESELRENDGYWAYTNDAPIIAEVVDRFSEDGMVLVDASSGFSVIMAAEYPQRLVISNDTDYFQILANPIATVGYILVLDPETQGTVNTVNLTYPTLFESGASWATLVWDSGEQTINHWRIYEVHAIE